MPSTYGSLFDDSSDSSASDDESRGDADERAEQQYQPYLATLQARHQQQVQQLMQQQRQQRHALADAWTSIQPVPVQTPTGVVWQDHPVVAIPQHLTNGLLVAQHADRTAMQERHDREVQQELDSLRELGPWRDDDLPRALHGGHTRLELQRMKDRADAWSATTRTLVDRMVACGCCGRTFLGGTDDARACRPTADRAHAFAAARFKVTDMLAQTVVRGEPRWWACHACRFNPDRVAKQRLLNPPLDDRARDVLHSTVILPPGAIMQLSLVRCPLALSSRWLGFVHGRTPARGEPLLSGPLVVWRTGPRKFWGEEETARLLFDIREHNMEHNPLMRAYMTASERYDLGMLPQPAGMPLLDDDAVPEAVAAQQARHPVLDAAEVLANVRLGAAVDAGNMRTQEDVERMHADQRYFLGSAHRRDAAEPRYMTADAGGEALGERGLTAEALLFPAHFPDGRGHNKGSHRMAEYGKQRVLQWFTPFTMRAEYVMATSQILNTLKASQSVRATVLESALNAQRRLHPRRTDAEHFRHLVKHVVPGSLPGSPAYHRNKLEDLMAMVDEYGMPSFFVTLTADEHTEMRWKEVERMEKVARRVYGDAIDWTDMPVEMGLLFHERTQAYMRGHILRHDGIFKRVTHHVLRYEAQGRGSLHAHVVLWVHRDDVEAVAAAVTASLPCLYAPHPDTGELLPVEPPAPAEGEQPSVARRLYETVLRKQIHRCKDSCLRDGDCRNGFPFDPCPEGTVFDPPTHRYKYLRLGPTDANISPYHPELSLTWNAHVNVQRITATDWSFYLLKYATKLEPTGALDVDEAAVRALGLSVGDGDQDAMDANTARLAAAACLAKHVCPCEAALQMLGVEPLHSDAEVVAISTALPGEIRRHAHAYGGVSVSPLQSYCARHEDHADLTMLQYFRRVIVRGRGDESRPRASDPDVPRRQDQLGQHVWERPAGQDALVRFSNHHPVHSPMGFLYNVILRRTVFSSATDVTPPRGTDYLTLAVQLGAIGGLRDIGPLVEEHARYRMWQRYALDTLRAGLLAKCDLSVLCALATGDGQDDDDLDEDAAAAALRELQDLMEPGVALGDHDDAARAHADAMHDADAAAAAGATQVEVAELRAAADAALRARLARLAREGLARAALEERGEGAPPARGDDAPPPPPPPDDHGPASLPLESLGEEQRAAVLALEGMLDGRVPPADPDKRPAPLLMVLTGGPGTGKSTTAKTMHARLLDRGRAVMVTATTAAAAERLGIPGADTVDSAMQIVPHATLQALRPDHPKHLALARADVVFLEEFSMLDGFKLLVTVKRLADATPKGALPKLLLLLGDHGQLPPVCRHQPHEDQICTKCHVMFTQPWKDANVVLLTRVYRQQGDLELLAFLNDMRLAAPSQDRVDRVLGRCVRPLDALADVYAPDATVLCTHRADVAADNAFAIRWRDRRDMLGGPVHRVRPAIVPRPEPRVERDLRPQVYKHHQLTRVAVGADVIFTYNHNKDRGLVNGATAVVTRVEDDHDGDVVALHVRLHARPGEHRVEPTHAKDVRVHGADYVVYTFPLALAYALTAHRCQGMTIPGRAILHIRKAFAPGIVYVMLSRVTTRDNLVVLGGIQADMLVPVPTDPEALRAMQRRQQQQQRQRGRRRRMQGGEADAADDDGHGQGGHAANDQVARVLQGTGATSFAQLLAMAMQDD